MVLEAPTASAVTGPSTSSGNGSASGTPPQGGSNPPIKQARAFPATHSPAAEKSEFALGPSPYVGQISLDSKRILAFLPYPVNDHRWYGLQLPLVIAIQRFYDVPFTRPRGAMTEEQ